MLYIISTGEQNGYNIPEMVPCPDFPYWLSEEGASYLATLTDDRLLPEHAKRLLCDAYMCMYQSPDVMMYKWFYKIHDKIKNFKIAKVDIFVQTFIESCVKKKF